MNRVRDRLSTPDVRLSVFDHPPGEAHHDPAAEEATRYSIAFVEEGRFDIHHEGRHWQFGEGTLFVSRPGMTFSCTHDDECPSDRCLSVGFDDRAVEELLVAGVRQSALPLQRATERQRYLRHRIATCAPGDEVRLDLLAGALFASLADDTNEGVRRPTWRVTDAMRRIDRSAELIECEYARPLALRDLAEAAGMSLYHFARVFGSLVGVPPHRYLAAVRLRHAADRLAAGSRVSSVALDVGFGSLSHFINAFKRHYGVSPSVARREGVTGSALRRAPVGAPVWR